MKSYNSSLWRRSPVKARRVTVRWIGTTAGARAGLRPRRTYIDYMVYRREQAADSRQCVNAASSRLAAAVRRVGVLSFAKTVG